jgi:hypothetical protein
MVRFHALHDLRRYTVPPCWGLQKARSLVVSIPSLLQVCPGRRDATTSPATSWSPMQASASKSRKRAAREDGEPAVSDAQELVRKLLEHREALRLYSTVAPEVQPPETSVWGLCEEYDEDHFDAMDEDFNRNAAYTRAFAAVPARMTKWLEVGCGASATLTKLALAHGPADVHRHVNVPAW